MSGPALPEGREERCETCLFWTNIAHHAHYGKEDKWINSGECRRYPPHIENSVTTTPRPISTYWCGEYSARAAK